MMQMTGKLSENLLSQLMEMLVASSWKGVNEITNLPQPARHFVINLNELPPTTLQGL